MTCPLPSAATEVVLAPQPAAGQSGEIRFHVVAVEEAPQGGLCADGADGERGGQKNGDGKSELHHAADPIGIFVDKKRL